MPQHTIHQSPDLVLYANFWGFIQLTGNGLFIVAWGVFFIVFFRYFPPTNIIVSVIIPLLLIGLGVFLSALNLFLAASRKPTLIVTEQGIQFGRGTQMIPWNRVLSLRRVKTKTAVIGIRRNHLLQLTTNGPTGTSKYLAQVYFTKPIPQVMQKFKFNLTSRSNSII